MIYPPLVVLERYALSPMKGLWTLEAQYARWLQVELAALGALEELGVVPARTEAVVRSRAKVDLERIAALEQEVGHDLLAFLWAVEEKVGPEGRWLHYGLTSSDVKDTALALTLVQALDVLLGKAAALRETLVELARRYRGTPMLGRTHGQWAEPTTFGLKVLGWAEECQRLEHRLKRARETIAVGKLSGAVGTYAYFPPEAEERALQALGLRPCPVATQVIARDRHAQVLFALASAASLAEKIALEVRHLSRSEVAEVQEGSPEGSSAMPHKKNPILSERLCGLSRLVRASLGPALEDNALWHERDLSHSSVERILFPQCFTLTDYMLDRARRLLRELRLYPEWMRRRLEEAQGLPFSEGLLLALVRAGMGRREAHELVALLSTQAAAQGRHLALVAEEDQAVRARLHPEEIRKAFDLSWALRHEGVPFARVLGEGSGYNTPGGGDA